MSTRVRADAQLFKNDNITTATTAATITLPSHTSSIMVLNTDGSINILVSFDGTNYCTLVPGASISVDCDSLKTYKIKSASGTPLANCIYGYEA